MRPFVHPVIGSLLSIAALAAPAAAQLPDWVQRTSNSPTKLDAEASIVIVQDVAGMHAFSSYTRTWSTVAVSSSAQFYLYDDHAIVLDGSMAYGYATRTARWVAQPIGAGAYNSVTKGGALWVTAIIDGNDVHVFSGLLGTWTSRSFSAAPAVAVGRMVAVVSGGGQTVGYSAYFGNFVPTTVPNVTSIDAVGLCGTATNGTYYHLYSAYRNHWKFVPTTPNVTLLKPPSRAGYVVLHDATSLTFYSAMQDNIVVVIPAPTTTWTLAAYVASVVDGNRVLGYSATTGAFASITTASAPLVETKRFVLAVDDGSTLYGFGAAAGKFESLSGSFSLRSDEGMLVAVPASASATHYAFSMLSNQWIAAPAASYVNAYVTFDAAILVDNIGALYGFSPRTDTWNVQPVPPSDGFFHSQAMFCARSGTRLDVFNGRTGAWATTNTSVAGANVTTFDMSVMADDGRSVYTYCLYTARWTSEPTMSTQTQLRDECAYAYDGTTLHVWSGSSQVHEIANAPEYWRVLSRGGPFGYTVAGEPNAVGALLINTGAASLPTPFGLLKVDPSGALIVNFVLPGVGLTMLHGTLPDLPALRGVTLHAQGAIVNPTTMQVYLTDEYESTIL